MKMLEILVPTHKRPHSAAELMDLALTCDHDQFCMHCNSNGIEPSLEKYRNISQNLTYGSFSKNMGVHANFLHLLSSSSAKFCMLLSDEDRFDPHEMSAFLKFLEDLNSDVSVIICSVKDSSHDLLYNLPPKRYSEISCDINLSAAFGLVPGYMSGITFRTEKIRKIGIEKFFCKDPGNAYPHIDIALNLLLDSKLKFYVSRFIIKGEDIKFGGDGYSHRDASEKVSPNHLDLNPAVYGPYARIQQFYYQLAQLKMLRLKLKTLPYVLAVIRILLGFIKVVRESGNVVVLPKDTSLRNEIYRGFADAHTYKIGLGIISWYFKHSVLSSLGFYKFFVPPLSLLSRVVGRLYAEVTSRVLIWRSR